MNTPTLTDAIDALNYEIEFFFNGTTQSIPDPLNGDSDVAAARIFDFQYAGTTAPADLPSSTAFSGYTNFTAAEITAFEDQLAYIETLINIDFVEVTGQADPTMNVGNVSLPGATAGFGGFGFSVSIPGGGTPVLTDYDNFVVFDNTLALENQINLLIHELGHALGLKHPFDGNPNLPAAFDNNKYSVMSYNANPDTGAFGDGYLAWDIAALQQRWGANLDTATGNDSYTGPRNSTIDVIWDAGGTDTLDASAKTTAVILDLNEGAFSRFGSHDDVQIAYGAVIENATGGTQADIIIGNDGDNTLSGGGGNDEIEGGIGADVINGGGGTGDIARYDDLSTAYTVTSQGGGVYSITGSTDGGDTLENIEQVAFSDGVFDIASLVSGGLNIITGSTGNDRLNGTANADEISGLEGNDTLRGFEGNDVLLGGAGNDRLVGTEGDDILRGDTGEDRMFGGGRSDIMDGGADRDIARGQGGADVFVFEDGDFSGTGGTTADRIIDFGLGADTLDLSGVDAVQGGGDDGFNFIGTSGFSGSAGELRYTQFASHARVFGDTDGDGTADFAIRLDGNHTLVATDFVL